MKHKPIALIFAALMLSFCLYLTWYLATVSSLRFQQADTDLSLETSYGRERKQQKEYDETKEALPAARAQLETLLPQVAEAEAEVTALKEKRRELREQVNGLKEENVGADLPAASDDLHPDETSRTDASAEGEGGL